MAFNGEKLPSLYLTLWIKWALANFQIPDYSLLNLTGACWIKLISSTEL